MKPGSTEDTDSSPVQINESRDFTPEKFPKDAMDGRSIHPDLAPAKDRILAYKRHTITTGAMSNASRPTTATTTARPTTAISKTSSTRRFIVNRDLVEMDSPQAPSTTMASRVPFSAMDASTKPD